MKGNCEVCEKEIEVEMCCSGRECGCTGLPIDPPFCSEECYNKFIAGRDQLLTPESQNFILDSKK